MSKPMITILTVNYKTSDFIELMLYSFKRLTYYPYKVIICDNYSSDSEIVKLAKIVQKYNNVDVVFRRQTQFGSIGHAEALDLLVSKVDTPYFVVMDSDCVFLKKDWDKDLIGRIDKKNKVIGTALPPTKENVKPSNFPLVFAVLYEAEVFKKLNPSFMPGNLKQDKAKDTGWEIREKYLNNNLSGEVFESKNTKYSKNTPFDHLYCAVYYLENYLIASHFGRGSSGGVAKYNNKWWFKIPLVSRLIRIYIGFKEKREWINICYKIINNEKLK